MYISEKQMAQIEQLIKTCIESNDGISLILSIISTGVAVIALVIAIRTAWLQNKVALYSKRLECYQQFQALKSFYLFSHKSKGFEDDGEEIVSKLRCKYLSIHFSLLDRDYQKNHSVLEETYIFFGIEKDIAMFESLEYLSLFNNHALTERAAQALESFITVLITPPKAIQVGGVVTEAQQEQYLSDLNDTKRKFEAAFSEILKDEANIKKNLKLPKF